MAKRNPTENETPNTEEGASTSTSSQGAKQAPDYLKAALRLSTSRPLGAPRTDENFIKNAPNFPGTTVSPGNVAVPGVMVLDYIPTYGESRGNTSALNRAVFNEFNAIRSQISGNRPYEPVDHMILRACIDSLRQLYYYVRRIYGMVSKYSATNLYRPAYILEAMGLDAQDWVDNAPSLYQWLLTHREALLPFPSVPIGSIADRHQLFDTYLFTDGKPDTTQTYVINHKWFYSYEKVDQVKGITMLKFPATFREFTEMWDTMYTAMQTSADVYTIVADIRRAFGDRVVTDLPSTDVDYVVEYQEFDDVLTSIRNADIVNLPDNAVKELFHIYDNGGGGLNTFTDVTSVNYADAETDPFLFPATFGHINMLDAEPEPGDILLATRLKCGINIEYDDIAPGMMNISMGPVGSEVITHARIVGLNSDGTTNITSISGCLGIDTTYHNVESSMLRLVQSLTALSVFDWHPPVAVWIKNATASATTFWNVDEDIQNYVPLHQTDIRNIHEANLLAEFGF